MDSARSAPYTIYVYYFTFCLFGGENKIMSMWFTFVKMFWHNWNSVSHERKFPITVVSLIQYIFQFLQVSFLPAMSLSHSQLPLQPVIVHYITAFNENYLLLTHLSELANVSRHIPPILASPPAQPNHPLPTNLSPHSSLPPFQAWVPGKVWHFLISLWHSVTHYAPQGGVCEHTWQCVEAQGGHALLLGGEYHCVIE